MPRRELKDPRQVADWLAELSRQLNQPVLRELPSNWEARASSMSYGPLNVTVPSPIDLLAPKLRRNEPRDRAHNAWAKRIGLID